MPIETRISTDEINIGDISLDLKERASQVFDAEKEITKSDWEMMDKQLQNYRGDHRWSLLPHLASSMKILNPSFNLELRPPEWKVLKDRFNNDYNNVRVEGHSSVSSKWATLIRDAADLKQLDLSWDPGFTSTDWQDMKTICLFSRQASGRRPYWDMFRMAADMKILNPKFDLDLIDKDFQGARRELRSAQKEEQWTNSLSGIASSIKIIDPEFNLGLTAADWKYMKNTLASERKNNNAMNIAILASKMKILASPGLKIPHPGVIEFQPFVKDVSKQEPSLPETKKF